MHTPLRRGDRVHNPRMGTGSVDGFGFHEGAGEHVIVRWDENPDLTDALYRDALSRVLSEGSGALRIA